MNKKSDSELQKEYQDYFGEKMEKHGVGSPSEFKDEGKMKDFFNEVSDGWECGQGRKEAKKTSSINVANIVNSIVAEVTKKAETLKEFNSIKDYQSYLERDNLPLKECKIGGLTFEVGGGTANTMFEMIVKHSDCKINIFVFDEKERKEAKEKFGGSSFNLVYIASGNSLIFNHIEKER